MPFVTSSPFLGGFGFEVWFARMRFLRNGIFFRNRILCLVSQKLVYFKKTKKMHRRIVSSSTQHGRSFRLFQKSLSSSSERHVEVVRKHLLNLHSAMGRLDGRDEET